MNGYFVTGIGTDVGKTVISAMLVAALKADYWKPVQAGDLDNSDSIKVQKIVASLGLRFHPERYRLNTPASPHYAAEVDELSIQLTDFKLPETDNTLIVEGAGGVLVPLNDTHTVLDLMVHLGLPVIVVSRHYLGSINHTLLTIEALKARGLRLAGIIFNGPETPSTESIIAKQGQVPILGRVDELDEVSLESLNRYGAHFEAQLRDLKA